MDNDKDMRSTEETENDILEAPKMDTLDALLFDSEDSSPEENQEDQIDFEAFMAEYRSLIGKNLAEAAEMTEIEPEEEPVSEEEQKKEYEEEYLRKAPKKQQPKKKAKKKEPKDEPEKMSEWNEDITLAPEEYEELLDENKIMMDEPVTEATPDFNLGESLIDDSFQLSMSFGDNDFTKPETTIPEDEDKQAEYDPEKPRKIDWVFDLAEMFVFVLAVVMILTSFVFKSSMVEGDSMKNTLEDGDRLFISDMFYTPERGDIVVFEDYSTALKKTVIKRVIGLPGETVEVKINDDGKSVTVYIDGNPLEEDYAYYASTGHLDACGPITLGENEVFVMGDNRLNSTDSCDPGMGPIRIDCILGKVLFRFFPFDKFGAVD